MQTNQTKFVFMKTLLSFSITFISLSCSYAQLNSSKIDIAFLIQLINSSKKNTGVDLLKEKGFKYYKTNFQKGYNKNVAVLQYINNDVGMVQFMVSDAEKAPISYLSSNKSMILAIENEAKKSWTLSSKIGLTRIYTKDQYFLLFNDLSNNSEIIGVTIMDDTTVLSNAGLKIN